MVRVVGELDDLAVARILATGASIAELEEAASEVEFDTEVGGQPIEPSSPRVAELRALLFELLVEEQNDVD